jgi:DNA-binding GntR family transcriptional regulator
MTTGTIAPIALYEEVAERLRARIFAHELAPGAWIDEQALAAQYGISRTPLREALKVLAAEGLVTLKPRRGCYVMEITERDLDEIFPLLALLEGRCAAEAARKASAADLRRLEALHAQLAAQAAQGDVDGFFETNQAFHLALQEIAGNRWLAQTIGDMRKVLKLTRHDSLSSTGRLAASVAEHLAVLRALHKRDPARAEQAMHAHLLAGREALAAIGSEAAMRRAAG